MIILITAGRWALTMALLYGVYTETGPWTTLALALVGAAFELVAWALIGQRLAAQRRRRGL